MTDTRQSNSSYIYSVVYIVGMVLLFIGERMVLDSTGVRVAMGCLAGAAGVAGRHPAGTRGGEALVATTIPNQYIYCGFQGVGRRARIRAPLPIRLIFAYRRLSSPAVTNAMGGGGVEWHPHPP